MKQMIVVTSNRGKYEKMFPDGYFRIIWCEFTMDDIITKRAGSNLLLLCMDHEDHNTLNRMALYLRDVCIEDEKMLYLYGNKEDVDYFSSLIPSMCIKKALYSFSHFDLFVDEIVQREIGIENEKACCVIIDDDTEYVERLRVHLDGKFSVVVCGFDPEEINQLIRVADLVLVSIEGRLKLVEFMGMFRLLLARKKSPNFRFYYLTTSDRERNIMNAGTDKSSLSFSKEMEVERVAKYLIDQYGSNAQG